MHGRSNRCAIFFGSNGQSSGRTAAEYVCTRPAYVSSDRYSAAAAIPSLPVWEWGGVWSRGARARQLTHIAVHGSAVQARTSELDWTRPDASSCVDELTTTTTTAAAAAAAAADDDDDDDDAGSRRSWLVVGRCLCLIRRRRCRRVSSSACLQLVSTPGRHLLQQHTQWRKNCYRVWGTNYFCPHPK